MRFDRYKVNGKGKWELMSVFKKDGAVAFTVPKYEGTFIAFNDGRDGFQSHTDSVVYLKGFTVSDANFINIT